MNTTAQNLRSALDLFDGGKNWIRGLMQNDKGCYCAAGAVNKAVHGDAGGADAGKGFKTPYLSTPEFQALHQAIADIDGPKWIYAFQWDPAHAVVDFNDYQDNFTMIERAFKRAIEIAEEAGK